MEYNPSKLKEYGLGNAKKGDKAILCITPENTTVFTTTPIFYDVIAVHLHSDYNHCSMPIMVVYEEEKELDCCYFDRSVIAQFKGFELYLKPTLITVWANVYKDSLGNLFVDNETFSTKEAAQSKSILDATLSHFVKTVSFEFEIYP